MYAKLSSWLRSSRRLAAWVFSDVLATRFIARTAGRTLAIVAFISFVRGFSAVFFGIRRPYLLREKGREGCANRILLRFHRHEACRKHAKLHRYDDFLFAGHADGNDQISGYITRRIDAKIPAVVVGRKSRLAGRIAEFRKSRKKCGINGGRHTDFEEVRKYQRLICLSNIYIGAYGEYRFASAAVGKEQIKLDDDVAGNRNVLRSENRGSHAPVIAFSGFGV